MTKPLFVWVQLAQLPRDYRGGRGYSLKRSLESPVGPDGAEMGVLGREPGHPFSSLWTVPGGHSVPVSSGDWAGPKSLNSWSEPLV